MYVRLKRSINTVFMNVEPSESFHSIKSKVGEIFERPAEEVKLFQDEKGEHELMNASTISDKEIPNDSIIFLVITKSAGSDQFEKIQVEALPPPGDEAAKP
mmetsp:Transcript_35380/g.72110  ORF Transcript_35380/g.72110 Transcript_35380/m.72110 type:complete len:101 (+) Transcript_35380:66-368(+)